MSPTALSLLNPILAALVVVHSLSAVADERPAIIVGGEPEGDPRPRPETPIERVAVLGPQHSGTNMMREQMARAFAVPVENFLEAPRPGGDRRRFFKHWFHHPRDLEAADRAATLVVVMVREPYAWLDAMFRYAHHTCRFESRAEMLAREHVSQVRRGYPKNSRICRRDCAELADDWLPSGRPQKANDRDPVTGLRFANILANRRAKLTYFRHLPFFLEHAPVVFVRYEDMVLRPGRVFREIERAFPIRRREGAQPPGHFVKPQSVEAVKGRTELLCFNLTMRQKVQEGLAPGSESFFGYGDLLPAFPVASLTAPRCRKPGRSSIPAKCCEPAHLARLRDVPITTSPDDA